MKPKLLLSLGAELPVNYALAAEAFGGEAHAAYLPPPSAEGYDALLLSGGGDIDPARYGAADTDCFFIDRRRDEAELALIRAFLEAGKPILGVCRGHQLINVYFGGTLAQDLPTAAAHIPTAERRDSAHRTAALPGSFLAALYGEAFSVNSAHHQGLDRLAPAMEAVQWAEDGVVEGCRHRTLPVWTVQWHPERMCLAHARPDTVSGAALFTWFIQTVKRRLSGAALSPDPA